MSSQPLLLHDHLEIPSEFPLQRVFNNILIHYFLILPVGGVSEMVPIKVVVKQTAATEGYPGGSFFLGGCS